MTKILILGGTKEAAELAAERVSEGHDVTTSLAGRTKEPKPLSGGVRVGGFGGVEGLVSFLKENRFEKLVDATHPFAKQISANAKRAAEETGIAFEIKIRKPWQRQATDDWLEVASLEEARDHIPTNARVLLALGSQHINRFNTRDDVFYLVRMVDQPANTLSLPNHQILTGRPSTDVLDEKRLLQEHAITHIVCRNSGGTGAYAKIEAARMLGLPVIMLQR